MAIGYHDQKNFAASVFADVLDNVIDWITSNLNPTDVFDESDLCESVGDFAEPDDVFKASKLDAWALDNGYVKENS